MTAAERPSHTGDSLIKAIASWAADQREREGWRDSDASTYRYRARLLESASAELTTLREKVRALEEERAFLDAAREYCRLWTRDHRNALDVDAVGDELAKARGAMYEAYRALVKEEGE